MNRALALLAFSVGVPAVAATYTVNAGSSEATIQTVVNTAGSAPGNTVAFSAGAYSLPTALNVPCSNGTVYTGPNVGTVSQKNLPSAVLSSTVATNYALSTNSNSTYLVGNQGCTIEYLRFSGTQGGIQVWFPASGIVIQNNAFDNNNPPPGGDRSEANIYLTGQNGGFSAATGVQHISILWNTFFNNCAAIRAVAYPDSGGGCSATWVNGYNNYLIWSNNTVDLTEEGLKLSEQSTFGISSLNADVENNNMQGNSRILIETQQDTNGAGIYSHNAFYQPYNPSYNTFELSVPEFTPSISPTHIVDDNVFIGNVPITYVASGGHYGIGLELWGAGSIATNNLFQGGNGANTCAAGWWCSGWQIALGEAFTNANISDNYFSGTEVWNGTANDMGAALTYEDSASPSNPGLAVTSNTVVQTSTTIPTVAPAIAAASGTGGSAVTLSNSDTHHALTMFYTTDGSTPAIFPPGGAAGSSRVYTAPFTVAAGVAVKAIASWGQGANQGIVFPSFGYVPSKVTTLAVTAQGRTLVSAYLHAGGNKMTKGGTLQFTAYGVYSDGSVSLLPDSQGNAVTGWNTSSHALAKVSMHGHVTAMGVGTVNVEAAIGTLRASVWTVTISDPSQAPPIRPATAAAEKQAVPAAAAEATAKPATQSAPLASAPAAVLAGPTPAGPGPAQPDGFLGPFWRLATPTGGSASISNSHLFIGVPGGSNHDPLGSSNEAVRVVQAIGNQDFDVAIKLDSPLFAGDATTSQGLIVLSDSQNFLTFGLGTDGTKISLSAHMVTRGVATTLLEDADFSQYQNPMYLRLTKSGSAYVALYSVDGVSWAQAASFTDTRETTAIGPFAGNYNDTPANAAPVVMSVNWFDVQQ